MVTIQGETAEFGTDEQNIGNVSEAVVEAYKSASQSADINKISRRDGTTIVSMGGNEVVIEIGPQGQLSVDFTNTSDSVSSAVRDMLESLSNLNLQAGGSGSMDKPSEAEAFYVISVSTQKGNVSFVAPESFVEKVRNERQFDVHSGRFRTFDRAKESFSVEEGSRPNRNEVIKNPLLKPEEIIGRAEDIAERRRARRRGDIPEDSGGAEIDSGAYSDNRATASGNSVVKTHANGSVTFMPQFNKEQADYIGPQDRARDRSHSPCSSCAHYIEGGGCHLVRGGIEPDGYCEEFYSDVSISAHAHPSQVEIPITIWGEDFDWSLGDLSKFVKTVEQKIRSKLGGI